MILHPGILALLIGSVLTGLMLVYASFYGVRIVAGWDIKSGSERQLSLERRTYLISTILSYTLAFQILSLFLFIYTADRLHTQFSGAMCAAGTLNAAPFGHTVLIMKIVNFLLAGVWLVINHADSRGYDYPLIRIKYALLLLMTPMIVLETYFLFRYFLGLHADVITSCCGSLFSIEGASLAGDLASLPSGPTEIAFFSTMAATLVSGIYFLARKRGGYLFSVMSFITFLVAVAALISFICLYFYELPSHHCPFCILQREYGYVGYALYATLLGGGVTGIGVGVLAPLGYKKSLARVIPNMQRRLVATALCLYLVFSILVSWRMIYTSFRL